MRTVFIETLCEQAEKDERIWLLTGDLGYSVLERFSQRFPKRFVNMGVAEQNMTGVAAGLALEGKIVFTYSIANFPIMRCLEQIRNDVCYHNLNVKVVAVGGGVAYGPAGYSHHAVEDLAVMRALPNMTVLAPGDPIEVKLATREITNWQGPCYLRLGKGGEPIIHTTEPAFTIGKSICMRSGNDVTLISTGGILNEVMLVAEQLAPLIQARVLSMPTLKPLDEVAILNAAKETKLLVTVEEHSMVGGLGSAVAEQLAKNMVGCSALLTLNLGDPLSKKVGTQLTLREQAGLTCPNLLYRIREQLSKMEIFENGQNLSC